MQVLQNKTWIGCISLFLAHQISQKLLALQCPFLDSYLDPFLSIPILLGGILLERRFFLSKYYSAKEKVLYQFSIFEIVILSTFFALLFEVGFPCWSENFTYDSFDFFAYFFGSLVFYFFINKGYSSNNQ